MLRSLRVPRARAALALVATSTLLASPVHAQEATSGIPGAAAPTANGPLLELAGKPVARAELPDDVRSALFDIEREAHEKTSALLKEFALRATLAREKDPKVALAKLPPIEALLGAPKPTEARVKAFYEQNKDKIPPGTPYERVRPQIEAYLGRELATEAFAQAVERQEKKGAFRLLAQAPTAPAITLELAGYPAKGPAGAMVTVVEVSDYLCPHCREAYPEVKKLLAAHGAAVRFVQVNFALRPDGLSGALARGAWCARKAKGDEAFWKFHEAAFTREPEAGVGAGDAQAVAAVAKAAGLAEGDLKACLDSREARAAVDQTLERFGRAGVTGTPTFFVNGRKEGRGTLAEAVRRAL